MPRKSTIKTAAACVFAWAGLAVAAIAAGPAPASGAALPEVYGNIMHDPGFAKAMTALSKERGRVSRGPMAARMRKVDALYAKARAALQAEGKLPAGAAEAGRAVQAELDGNPGKYPEWLPLCRELDALKAKDDGYKARIKALYKARMKRLDEDRKAVAAGKAVFKKVDEKEADAMWAERWKPEPPAARSKAKAGKAKAD